MTVLNQKFKCLTLAILAGGFSKRMGQDKGLMLFRGKPLIVFIVEKGKSLTDDLLITTNNLDDYQFLNTPLYKDQLTQRGTIVGVHTSLHASHQPYVAIIGCDMPFFSIKLLINQIKIIQKYQIDAVIPHSQNGLEPLHGVYKRESCLLALEKALNDDVRSLLDWFKYLKVQEISVEGIRKFDPEERAFINLNTPEEFRKAEQLYFFGK